MPSSARTPAPRSSTSPAPSACSQRPLAGRRRYTRTPGASHRAALAAPRWLSQVVDSWFSRVRIDRFPGSGSPLFACPRIRQAAAQGRNRAR
jgi:hypothetical protein